VYQVTITNASATTFTPLLAVAHRASIQLFEAGAAPSDAFVGLAESDGTAGFMADLAAQSNKVGDVQSSAGLLGSGESVVAGCRFHRLSLAAMLLPTNDSFVGLQSVALPRSRGASLTYHALVYDAGSETNDELCANIPGPQCGGAALSPEDRGADMCG
jgi:hypothetical protein